MSRIPDDLKYTESHEWLRDNGDGAVVIGITDYAQDALGDLVYVELPDVGDHVGKGETCATVESVKSASDIYSPLPGEIVETNDSLADAPEQVNNDPYDDGWLFRLRLDDSSALDDFMNADAYREFCEAEDS